MTSVDLRVGFVAGVSIVVAATAAHATFEITSAIQAELDRQKKVIAGWAADPVIVKAVADQNVKGPLPGVDNAAWKALRRSDPVVRAFQSNPAGKFLRATMEASGGLIAEALLRATGGGEVAFAEQATAYIRKGRPRFDVRFTTRSGWRGRTEFGESSQRS